MNKHARERGTAAFLQNEYGKPLFTIIKGDAVTVLPWTAVQQRAAKLIDSGWIKAIEEPAITEPVATEPVPVEASEPAAEPEVPTSPLPVFLRDKNEIHDMDLSLYNDGDVLGYDKNGVEYSVSRVGEYNFITTTSRITPMGDILGVADIPSDILRQIRVANGLEAAEPPAPELAPPEAPAQESKPS